MRVPAKQICPLLARKAKTAPGRRLPNRHLQNNVRAFAANSSVTGMILSAAILPISRPARTEPVKAILATSSCLTSASPASAPAPVTTFSTPSGSRLQRPARQTSARWLRCTRWVVHHRIADRQPEQCRGKLVQRRVPRRNDTNNAIWLMHGIAVLFRPYRNMLALQDAARPP